MEKHLVATAAVIYLAGGCFWGTQRLFTSLPGVIGTQTGYANSAVPSPSYKQVCTGATDAAEAVKVTYDADVISLPEILDFYWKSVDPYSLNRQGGDRGTQYRTGIYYTDPVSGQVAEDFIGRKQMEADREIMIEVLPLANFYPAEEYHQDYLLKNPGGYCHVNPALFAEARDYIPKSVTEAMTASEADSSDLRGRLTPMQYAVTRHGATEPPFRNEYWDNFEPGIYVDIISGEPLFVSSDKFESGCRWPAVSRPVLADVVTSHEDTSHNMVRTEIRAAGTDSHLGHVFPDGPRESGGLRYCINSAALRFVPLSKMEAEGYGKYIPLVGK